VNDLSSVRATLAAARLHNLIFAVKDAFRDCYDGWGQLSRAGSVRAVALGRVNGYKGEILLVTHGQNITNNSKTPRFSSLIKQRIFRYKVCLHASKIAIYPVHCAEN